MSNYVIVSIHERQRVAECATEGPGGAPPPGHPHPSSFQTAAPHCARRGWLGDPARSAGQWRDLQPVTSSNGNKRRNELTHETCCQLSALSIRMAWLAAFEL